MIKEAIAQLVDGHALTMDEGLDGHGRKLWKATLLPPNSGLLSRRCGSTGKPWMKLPVWPDHAFKSPAGED